ncbi:hypothetical protein GW17_00029088 [Ensete ventricosum]|nr:hypothetical protein GW17_00029088 [Ensete ventricosum]
MEEVYTDDVSEANRGLEFGAHGLGPLEKHVIGISGTTALSSSEVRMCPEVNLLKTNKFQTDQMICNCSRDANTLDPQLLALEAHISRTEVKEYADDFSKDMQADVISPKPEMLACGVVSFLKYNNNVNNLQRFLPQNQKCEPVNTPDAQVNNFSLRRKGKKTATDSVERALEEDAPGLLQIKRLVTAMKLTSCSRTTLIENRPLLVGEDLTEGEARVLEEYGWTPNCGLGTMLNYCDRVVHDKKYERYSNEWRAKIGRLLMEGHDAGRTILVKLPKRVVKHKGGENLKIKVEN